MSQRTQAILLSRVILKFVPILTTSPCSLTVSQLCASTLSGQQNQNFFDRHQSDPVLSITSADTWAYADTQPLLDSRAVATALSLKNKLSDLSQTRQIEILSQNQQLLISVIHVQQNLTTRLLTAANSKRSVQSQRQKQRLKFQRL